MLARSKFRTNTSTVGWENLRRKHGNEQQDGLRVGKCYAYLLLVESLVLDTGFIACDPSYCDKALALFQKPCAGWRIGQQEPNHESPYAGHASKL